MTRVRAVVLFVAAIALTVMATTGVANAGDGPTGFYWGTDGSGPAPGKTVSQCRSSSQPWLEPNIMRSGCGRYGGYIGKIGDFQVLRGCSNATNWNSSAAADAEANFKNYSSGMSAQLYWFGGGPGADPHFNGTTTEAQTWGQTQAEKAANYAASYGGSNNVIWLDVEDGPHSYSGWNETLTGCANLGSSSACCSAELDSDTLHSFINYIFDDTTYWVGVYSSIGEWGNIFGSSSYGNLTNVMEWAADWGSGLCANPGPYGWTQGTGSGCSRKNSPSFFGSMSSSSQCAVAWQWYGSLAADYDQLDVPRLKSTSACE